MSNIDLDPPEQVEPNPAVPVGVNPAPSAFNVTVLVPEQISIRMVDASGLADYEYHVIAASLLFGAAIGFLVPCLQEFRSNGDLAVPFLMFTVILFLLCFGAGGMAMSKRKKLTTSGKEIKLTTTGASIG
jgi:hypothetical protein